MVRDGLVRIDSALRPPRCDYDRATSGEVEHSSSVGEVRRQHPRRLPTCGLPATLALCVRRSCARIRSWTMECCSPSDLAAESCTSLARLGNGGRSDSVIQFGAGVFVDAVRVERRADEDGRGDVDVGGGLRLGFPGLDGVFRLDLGKGLRDGSTALSFVYEP